VVAVTAPVIELETEDLVAAARRLRLWVAEPLEHATTALAGALGGCGAMAGSDPGGLAWAAAYDHAAAPSLAAAQDVVNAVDRLAARLAQTARNYEEADSASTPDGRRAAAAAVATLPCIESYFLPTCAPPSAAGGSGAAPHGWGLVSHLVGYMWPNGHQDRLRAAAAAWRASASALSHGADGVVDAAGQAIADGLPEAPDIWVVCDAMGSHLRSVAAVHRGLADACDELAGHIDAAHSAVVGELESLLEWTAAIQVGGGLLSAVTLGAAEVPTQAVQASRIAATAVRVAAVIERFVGLAQALARTVAALVERAETVGARLRAVIAVRLTEASVAAVGRVRLVRALGGGEIGALGRLPNLALRELRTSSLQLERKFKHAAAFGVTLSRGSAGFKAFDQALRRFVADPRTTTVWGTYRGNRALLSYQASTRLIVVRSATGDFLSGWEMTEDQLEFVVVKRSLGGE
jgi:Colicin D